MTTSTKLPDATTSSTVATAVPSMSPSPEAKRKNGLLAAIYNYLPTLAIMALLGTVGIYGHNSHWKLPRFAELSGKTPALHDDWCEEHGVPESQCVECNPELFPPGPDYGWCLEHGVHNCTFHHPGVAQLKSLEGSTEVDSERAANALALRNRHANNAACKVYQSRIQFASIDAVEQAGVDVELVERRPMTEWVSGNGEIRYDSTRFANLSSRVPGTASRVLKNIGDDVLQGDVLAIVDAMEVGRLKSHLVKAIVAEELARKNIERIQGLPEGLVAGKEILEAEAVYEKAGADVLSAEQALANLGLPVDAAGLRNLPKDQIVERMRFLGIPQGLVQQISSQTTSANLIPIRSPMDGVVVERHVVVGEVVDSTETLFEVADPSVMWLILNIPLEDAGLLQLGQSIRFLPNGSQKEVVGTLSWISTAADKQTRMVNVRAELNNERGQLRDETFGTGRIILREVDDAIVVSKNAVHWEGCCQVVFVRDKAYFDGPSSPKLFHVRTVRTGATDGDLIEIIAGLLPGEVVVTQGSDVLRAQLLKNSLGAGCCAE